MRHRERDPEDRTRGVLWGLMLVGLGVLFLVKMYGLITWDFFSSWWALFPMGAGLAKIVTARGPRGLGSGVTTLALGCWLLVAANGWYGLTWYRSWPLVLVAVGLGTLVQGVAGYLWRREEDGHVG